VDPELASSARAIAADAWGWAQAQVRWDAAGPWLPLSVSASGGGPADPLPDRDNLYDGLAGLAPGLAEVRLARPWTAGEQRLADAVVARLVAGETGGDCSLYAGLAGSIVAVELLEPGSAAGLLEQLAAAATAGGWPMTSFEGEGGPVNDLVLGTAGVVLVCAWLGGGLADELAAHGAEALVATARPAVRGVSWKMHEGDRARVMPNYSHGTAGIAAALAVAGDRLGRADLVELARLGAEHVVAIADSSDGGLKVFLQEPPADGPEPFAYGWCHGPTGTARLFGALELAGVADVGGLAPALWRRRAARSVRSSGLPARLRPGFWDNDGRCCGTAGVLDAALDDAQAAPDPQQREESLAWADQLAASLVARAVPAPVGGAAPECWRFVDHTADPPELDPAVGWMQGAAGISAVLHRYVRVRRTGAASARVGLPDDWWMVPGTATPAGR
jgi:hypothetical protein